MDVHSWEKMSSSVALMSVVPAGWELEECELQLQNTRLLLCALSRVRSLPFFCLPISLSFSISILPSFSLALSVWCSCSAQSRPSMLRVNEGGWCGLPLVTRPGCFNRPVTQTWYGLNHLGKELARTCSIQFLSLHNSFKCSQRF